MENRKTLIIPENKEKIKKIKDKYENANMSDNTAKKIMTLEVANDILKKASLIAGIAFVIDLIIPDPIIGIDEAILGGITGASKTANTIIENKIDDLAKNGNTEVKQEEITSLANDIKNIVESIKSKNSRSV